MVKGFNGWVFEHGDALEFPADHEQVDRFVNIDDTYISRVGDNSPHSDRIILNLNLPSLELEDASIK